MNPFEYFYAVKDALIKMHIAVFLWGFTGVLGRAIQLEAFPLVWYRVLLTSVIFLVVLSFRKELIKLSAKEILRFFLIGSVIAIHWCMFYGSIKYANASIALVCLATAGIFTAILEPFVLRIKFNPREMIIGFIALIGMYLIYTFEFKYAIGIALGIGAAVLSSVFTVMNKKIVGKYNPRLVAFYEIGAGFLFLTLLLPVYHSRFPEVSFVPSEWDWIWLIVLSLFCTVLGQSLALAALKKLSSFTAVLMVNLEPVYGILLAILIYKENQELGWGFWLGILFIGGSVFLHTMEMLPKNKKRRDKIRSIMKPN